MTKTALKLSVKYLSAFYLLLLPFFSASQTITEKFGKLTISENFDSVSSYWTTLANGENLFIMQDGEYILQRKSGDAPYAIIANFENTFADFRLVSSIKLDEAMGNEATVGILFMMQDRGQGGFLVEINKSKEFRLRQISGGVYKYITGTSKNGGWVKNSHINEAGVSNMIEVKSFNRNYDLFINGAFLLSFSEPSYRSGKIGIIIGPKSRAKIDFMYLFTKSDGLATGIPNGINDSTGANSDKDIIELAESIILLKTQVNQLQDENEGLKKTISAMKSGDQEKDVTVRNLEKQVDNLEVEIKSRTATIDSLSKANKELKKYEDIVGKENGDIVISLSKALKAEKEKNKALQEEIEKLKKNPSAPSGGNGNSSQKPSPKPSSGNNTKNSYSLPGD